LGINRLKLKEKIRKRNKGVHYGGYYVVEIYDFIYFFRIINLIHILILLIFFVLIYWSNFYFGKFTTNIYNKCIQYIWNLSIKN
jgi:hypothetical protein